MLLARNMEEWFWGIQLMVPAKTCILDFDRHFQVVLHRGWVSFYFCQQYVRASVSLTFIHMVLSKFWSANLVALICISLIKEKTEHIFICLKATWNFFPGNCLFIILCPSSIKLLVFFLLIYRNANYCSQFFMSFGLFMVFFLSRI